MRMNKVIQAGTLSLTLSKQDQSRLLQLVDFASRENQKRGFLFVSKVLGKHIPVRPSAMRAIYNELADRLPLTADAFVVGMAETATGLGAGVADSLARAHAADGLNVFYQHTTRHILPHEEWFRLSESHSHAVDHLVYRPDSQLLPHITACRHLILIDDEITTGKTLLQLAQGFLQQLPGIEKITIISLLSWLDDSARLAFDQLPVPVTFLQLVKGLCQFTPDDRFQSRLPDQVDRGVCTLPSLEQSGRLGLRMPVSLSASEQAQRDQLLAEGRQVTIVGTGEYLYQPFLIAEELEQQGMDVLFQSTTRSPIIKGDAIERKVVFPVHDDKQHYIYNLPRDRQFTVICETEALAAQNGLLQNNYQDF